MCMRAGTCWPIPHRPSCVASPRLCLPAAWRQVTKIDSSRSDKVIITTSSGVFTAKQVVVAVPLGVLQRNAIQFIPALPAPNRAAINSLGMGLLNKVGGGWGGEQLHSAQLWA